MIKQRINYQIVLDETIAELDGKPKPTLLLHICCAPCATAVIEYLMPYFEITVLYYNPNICDEEEHQKRFDELLRLLAREPYAGKIKEVLLKKYAPHEFESVVKEMKDQSEKGTRCQACIALRLQLAAYYAEKLGADYFTTTLTVSPHKDEQFINKFGAYLAQKTRGESGGNTKFLQADFKKKDGYKRSVELSGQYDLYRQNFCGCIYSKES